MKTAAFSPASYQTCSAGSTFIVVKQGGLPAVRDRKGWGKQGGVPAALVNI